MTDELVTSMWFGPVPPAVAEWFARFEQPWEEAGIPKQWAKFDRHKVGPGRTATIYLDFRVAGVLSPEHAIVEVRPEGAMYLQPEEYDHPIGNWSNFASMLRASSIAYDFVRAANHGAGATGWDRRESGGMVLERWRPGMRTPHVVALDASGKPSLGADQLAGVLANDRAAAGVRIEELLGNHLGRLNPRMVQVMENAAEVDLALGGALALFAAKAHKRKAKSARTL